MPTPPFVLSLRSKIGHDPLWLSGITAVVVREIDGVDHVLLIQRSDNGRWTPVNGIIDPGEHPADAAVREVREEASVECEVIRMTSLSVTGQVRYLNGDVSQYIDHAFLCRWLSGAGEPGDDEALAVQWCPIDALPAMDSDNTMRTSIALEGDPECRLVR